jgi:hypothetical protein
MTQGLAQLEGANNELKPDISILNGFGAKYARSLEPQRYVVWCSECYRLPRNQMIPAAYDVRFESPRVQGRV